MRPTALSRRGFVSGAGALSAATVFAPQALADGLEGNRRSQGLGEGGGGLLPDADPRNPKTPERIVDARRGANPWVRDADFDHHGYGLVTASQSSLRCTFRRVASTKRRSTKTLPDERFSYRVQRGRPSLT